MTAQSFRGVERFEKFWGDFSCYRMGPIMILLAECRVQSFETFKEYEPRHSLPLPFSTEHLRLLS